METNIKPLKPNAELVKSSGFTNIKLNSMANECYECIVKSMNSAEQLEIS